MIQRMKMKAESKENPIPGHMLCTVTLGLRSLKFLPSQDSSFTINPSFWFTSDQTNSRQWFGKRLIKIKLFSYNLIEFVFQVLLFFFLFSRAGVGAQVLKQARPEFCLHSWAQDWIVSQMTVLTDRERYLSISDRFSLLHLKVLPPQLFRKGHSVGKVERGFLKIGSRLSETMILLFVLKDA